MLTQETKRKIDSARQILVGKVPDPKAQVEQITTALIYKFMDDMDKEAQELGGKARFFTNGYQKYAWTKLMDAKLGGHERLDLYLEAITSLSRNPHIPQLFRDIFKDAFLPYRSPETLSMFLKEINGFTYEHSEDLGDAFEYLLSILGSQGDAGQFRTPRHIIDFIVAAVAPNKGETICDPACGTAGFLISAFKYILKENKEKSLTPDERKNLMDHFVGYDISPDMVRLSKVNLYLHGFPSPTIFEYDTLSSEEKWDENFDVMLANPPFMSPSGGIRPHKRFSVQANRSEVLFVDYILEHLRPNGRAGIIVPEGIIFQSATAYKALRKLLIEDGLLAVISLPAGVFNPYAGVKTSILLFDNGLAKKTKEILFLKIQNDGYSLGAQRREIDKNDLPLALEIIKKYRAALKDSKKFGLNAEQAKIAHLVAKDKIAESGDYNLSGDRYRENVKIQNSKFKIVELGEVCEIEKGTSITKAKITNGDIPVVAGGQQPAYYHNQSNRDGQTITVSASGAYAGFINFFEIPIFASDCTTIKSKDENNLLTKFVFHFLKTRQKDIYKLQKGMGQPHVYGKDLAKIKIPLPPIEVQKEIVEQIEVKQKAIEAAKAVIENLERERRYFGQAIRKIEGVEWVEFEKIIKTITPPAKIQKSKFGKVGKYPIIDQSQESISGWTDDERLLVKVKNPVVIFGDHTCVVKYSEKQFVQGADGIKILETNEKLLPKFFYYFLKANPIESEGYKRHFSKLRKIKIPLPSLETQKQLVAEMEEQEKIIEANKKLVGIMEQKISDVLSEI
jgi:type I restriction enzyme M protein